MQHLNWRACLNASEDPYFIHGAGEAAPSTEVVYAHKIAGCFAQLCQLLRLQYGAYSQRSPKWATGFGDLA
ncbi:hypothetical protein TU85_10465 [Pseudomonas helleri]|nr:hypothetical protein TU85_10465 [Pseudomonas helleri]